MLGTRKAVLLLGVLLIAAVLAAGCGGPTGTGLTYVSQWTGSGPDKLDSPEGLAIDPTGRLLVADTWNDRILRCDADGKVLATIGAPGHATDQLECPRAVTTDAQGNIYVADTFNQRIKKFSKDGRLLLSFGEKGAPFGNDEADGKYVYPVGVAVDSKGFIYVSDYNNNRIHKFDSKGKFVLKWGVDGRQDGQFNHPGALVMDSKDRLYVADVGNNRIQRFRGNVEGTPAYDGQWGKDGTKPGEFDRPYGLAVDKDGNTYVADFGNHRIQKFDASGKLQFVYDKFGDKDGELDSPMALAVVDGSLFVSDWGNNRIQKFSL